MKSHRSQVARSFRLSETTMRVGPFNIDGLDVNNLLEEWRWLCPDAVT
jgi:hypothetical protein